MIPTFQTLPFARRCMLAGVVTGPLALMLLSGCASMIDSSPPTPGQISGRYIAVICDADMSATAFADGLLSRRSPDDRDMLTVIRLPLREPGPNEQSTQTDFAQVEVSNSVMGPARSLSVTPCGTLALVLETRGRAGPGALRVGDLPAGRVMTPIDLRDPMNPIVGGLIDVPSPPVGVDISPRGDWAAVATNQPGSQLIFFPIRRGEDGGLMVDSAGRQTFDLPGLEGAAVSSVIWHPSGRYVALTMPQSNSVAFYEVGRDSESLQLARWGAPVEVGPYPFDGAFTPDGRRFIATELHWGTNVDGYLIGAPEGSLSVIELSRIPSAVLSSGASGEAPVVEHTVTDTVRVGISPEGLAISPDGRWVVTANLRRSMLPASDPRMTPGGSLTLLSMGRDGKLVAHGEFDLNAMPEGIAFDARGRHVVVTQFRSFDPNAVDGELSFHKLVPSGDNGQPTLVPGRFTVGVGVGPHGVVIVR
jgi:DNA-binding beta-propeller fold protein YncE/uncharacterized protein YceK